MTEWQIVLMEPAKTVFTQISNFLMNSLLVLLILLLGWILSSVVKALVIRVLRGLKLDELSVRIELDALLAKGGIKHSLSELLGAVAYWLLLLVTFVVAVNAIGLTVAADLLERIILYVPNVIAAIFILILGMFVATVLRNVVQTAASNAGISQVNLISKVVEYLVIAFAIVTAMKQLRIDTRLIELAMGVMLGSFGLAVGLSFGLGCKDLAGKFIGELIEKVKVKK